MSKLVSVTVSLTTVRVREGLSILFSTAALRRVDAIAAGLTLVDQLVYKPFQKPSVPVTLASLVSYRQGFVFSTLLTPL